MNGDSNRSEASKTLTKRRERLLSFSSLSAILVEVEAELHDLQIPVAEAAPEELVDRVCRVIEAIVFKRLVHLGWPSRSIRRRSSAIRAARPDSAIGIPPSAAMSTVIPTSAARSTFMNMNRAAFQILFANAR